MNQSAEAGGPDLVEVWRLELEVCPATVKPWRDEMTQEGPSRQTGLPNGGLEIITEFITHQDTTTWAAISVFITGELLLLAIGFQTLTLSNLGRIALIGILLTVASGLILRRGNAYLEKYYDLAKQRASDKDKSIFDVKLDVVLFRFKGQPVKLPRAYSVLVLVHLVFLSLWLALLATYFAPLLR